MPEAPRPLDGHLDRLGWLRDPGEPAALLLDFDGTLVPIHSRPRDAVLPRGMADLLGRLAARPGCLVALVSGRGLADLKRQAPVEGPVYRAGNHGLEMEGPDLAWVHPEARRARPFLEALCAQVGTLVAGEPGLLVEDKGLSASIHYRGVDASRRDALLARLGELVRPWEADGRLRVTWGKCVMELRPPVEWDKGRAARRLLAHADIPEERTLAIGDDRTDESTFAALPGAITVRVGPAGAAPTAARYRLEDPDAVGRLLAWAADRDG
jgi:trehalose 6-phosphate phosphatase